jgi:hypothetical protein
LPFPLFYHIRFISLSLAVSLPFSLSFMFQQYPQKSFSVYLTPPVIYSTALSHFVKLLLLLLLLFHLFFVQFLFWSNDWPSVRWASLLIFFVETLNYL